MTVSKVSIANGGLQRLGAARISALDQDDPNARSMNVAYDGARDALLRKYDWSFAIKRASVAADGTDETILSTWKRYALPNDFIRLLRDDESGIAVDWKIEGRYILSGDASPLEFRYIAQIDDPTYYDAMFVEALSLKLASDTCEEITQSTSKKKGVDEDLADAIADARRCGAIEKAAQEFPEDDWLAARR